MNIEWWYIDGIVGLIILAAAIVGAVKGIGDTVLRIAGIIGGLALGTVYSGKVAEWLSTTRLSTSLHDHIYGVLSVDGSDEVVKSNMAERGTDAIISEGNDTTLLGSISRSLGDILGNAADRAAEDAAARLTEIALSIFSFVIILLAVAIVVFLIRLLIRSLRDKSLALGFADRTLGLVLGAVRGLLLAWVAVALLIPVTTWLSPENVPAMITALQETTAAKVLYDVNPLLMLVKYVFTA